jgi:hypothetical protein
VFRLIVTTVGEVVSDELDRRYILKERLRQALIDQAQTGIPTTYKELATASDLNRRRQFTASVRHSRPS